MTTHAEAAKYADTALTMAMPENALLPVRQALCGVGYLETGYGDWWKGAGVGSNNIGADQSGRPPCNPATSFLYRDTHPNPDGTSTSYEICFGKYASPEKGWARLVHVMYEERPSVLREARNGNLYGVSYELRQTSYYEGVGKTQTDRINNHFKALSSAVRRAATALGEPMPDGKPTIIQKIQRVVGGIFNAPKQPTLRRGSFGTAVKDWQRFLGIAADGAFGPITEQETIVWQGKHKNVITGNPLHVDGVVGTETWAAAEVEAATLPEAA